MRLVLPVVLNQPAHVIQDCIIIPHGYHGSLLQHHKKVADSRSDLPRRRCTVRGRKRNKGMGPSSPNSPASHPGGERHQGNLDSEISAIHPSPFPECTERGSPPRRFLPNLHREQSLLTNLIFPIPLSRIHHGDTIS